jgi:hypothetical protein
MFCYHDRIIFNILYYIELDLFLFYAQQNHNYSLGLKKFYALGLEVFMYFLFIR